MELKVFIIKCTICGKPTGQWEPPVGWKGNLDELTIQDLGFDDVRCDDHPAT